MKTDFVGIGELKIADSHYSELKVMGLGSCVAVIFYSAVKQILGIAHVALPTALNGEYSQRGPAYFADDAIVNMLEKFKQRGVFNRRDFTIKLVGGASIMDPHKRFDIGNRNIVAIKKILWLHQLAAFSEDLGGRISRTVKVDVASGRVLISSPDIGSWELK
ncbi:MAG: chemotaxis protein CheD [Calditrichaeota bacterium]|nr:chemotaxis protein CheD [Calditrichota bacterium]